MQARGERIRRERKESGYGLRDFAHLVEVSPSWLSRIERGLAKKPSPEVLRRIALALHQERETRAAITQIARHETEGSDDDTPDG